MVIPYIDQPLQSFALYPDSIAFNKQYFLADPTPSYLVSEVFRTLPDFRQQAWMVLGTLRRADNSQVGEIAVTKGGAAGPLNVRLRINPIRAWRYGRPGRYRVERPRRPDWYNYLPSEVIRDDNQWMWRRTGRLVEEAYELVDELLRGFHREGRFPRVARHRGPSLDYIELCHDVRSEAPDRLVNASVPIFRQLFRYQEDRTYSRSFGCHRLEGDSVQVHGFRAKDERYKAYVKTDQRVRFEVCLRKPAIRRVLRQAGFENSSRYLNYWDNGLCGLIETLADEVAPFIENVLEQLRCPPTFGLSVVDFIRLVVAGVRRSEFARDALHLLIHNGAIESSFDHQFVRRLIAQGVLQRSVRGRAHLTEQCIPAATWLRDHGECLNPFQMREVVA